MSTILVISDLHCPYQHPGAIDFLADLKAHYKPDHVVCIGDEIDAYAFSKYVKDPEMPSGGQELKLAVSELKKLYKLFPNVSVCESNHTARPWQRALEAGLPAEFMRSYREVLEAPDGWTWGQMFLYHNDKIIRNPTPAQAEAVGPKSVLFMHGEEFGGQSSAKEAATRNHMNSVIGHSHCYGAIAHVASNLLSIWGMNVGCLLDPNSKVNGYTKKNKSKPTLGTGLIIDGTPLFLQLNKY